MQYESNQIIFFFALPKKESTSLAGRAGKRQAYFGILKTMRTTLVCQLPPATTSFQKTSQRTPTALSVARSK